jgi:hypothetical protein
MFLGEVWYGKWRGLVEVAIKTMKVSLSIVNFGFLNMGHFNGSYPLSALNFDAECSQKN